MSHKKPKLNEVIAIIGVLLGICGFFTAMVYKEYLSGWLNLIYPISLLISFTSAGLGASGLEGSIIYALWFLIFLSNSIFLAIIFSKITIIPLPIALTVTFIIAGFMAQYIASKNNGKL